MIKQLFSLLTVFLIGILMSSVAYASHIEIIQVKIDNDVITESGNNFIRDVERGEELKIKVEIRGNQSVDDVQIEATGGDVFEAMPMKKFQVIKIRWKRKMEQF